MNQFRFVGRRDTSARGTVGRPRGLATAVLATAVFAAAGVAACGSRTSLPADAIDLLARLPGAERLAPVAPDEAIRVDVVRAGGEVHTALVMAAPSRLIYRVELPKRARLITSLAPVTTSPGPSSATARVGLSTGRRYEELLRLPVEPAADGSTAWRPILIDLGDYSGWQWSVFYRPASWTWRLILNADATPGGAIAWARPVIEMR